MAKDRFLQDKAFLKKLLTLTLPIALQSLLLASVAASDAFMLGRIEQNAMAAVSLATQIQFVQNMIVSSAVAAEAVLGAQYWGSGDKEKIKGVFFTTLKLSGLTSLLFFLACILSPTLLMHIFTSDPVLVDIGVHYLRLAGWSYLLTGISQCYLALFKVTEKPQTATLISTVAVLLNIVLNAFFIFGFLFIPALGAEGAAIATLISRVVELLLALGLTYGKGVVRPEMKKLFHFDKELFQSFYRCALPLIGAYLVWGVGFTSYSAFMGHLGADAAAANSVASVIRDLVCCLCSGAASGAGILVGNELGAGRLERGRLYGDRIVKISFLIGIFSTLVMLLLVPVSLSFVKLTGEARTLLVGMMAIMAFYMIGRSVNGIVINGIFASGGDTLFDMYSLTVAMWCIAVPLAALGTFVFHWPVLVVYACTCLDEVGKIPWTMLHYRKYKWVKNLTK
ncbi:MAG: MATE family efflux transporter [Spirochaetales bacterium]|nr:MATE family efflux transporter [Candidatus Physcosoma equi]